MITVLLVTDCAEVVILHYDTDSEDDAARLFGSDWAEGRVVFESMKQPGLFGLVWVKTSIEEALTDMIPQYDNGVRFIDLYCTGGSNESDDREARVYFVHSTNKR